MRSPVVVRVRRSLPCVQAEEPYGRRGRERPEVHTRHTVEPASEFLPRRYLTGWHITNARKILRRNLSVHVLKVIHSVALPPARAGKRAGHALIKPAMETTSPSECSVAVVPARFGRTARSGKGVDRQAT